MATLGSKAPTPAALQFHKFQEWSQSNQHIFKLQSKILDLEAAKIRYSMLKLLCNMFKKHETITFCHILI